jgi:hypothetical protein
VHIRVKKYNYEDLVKLKGTDHYAACITLRRTAKVTSSAYCAL